MNRRNAIQFVAKTSALIWAGGLFSACKEGPSFHAIDITGADYARDFALTDHNGQSRTLADFRGKVVMVFFGYTQCPDVCPTSMTEMAAIKKALGADADRFQGLFVTVDPQRDKPDMLKAYMESFDPTFLALYTTPEQTAALAKDFKVFYKKVPGSTPDTYTIDHTAGSYVYDPSGKLRLFTRYNTQPEVTVADLRVLLQGR